MISHDVEAGKRRKEEPISLNKIKSEKAGAYRPEFYLRGGIPSVITGLGVDFPACTREGCTGLATSLTPPSSHLE